MKFEIKSIGAVTITTLLLTSICWANGPGEIGSATNPSQEMLCSQHLPQFQKLKTKELTKGIDALARLILGDAYRNRNLKYDSIKIVDNKDNQITYRVEAGKDSINAVAIYKVPPQGTYELYNISRYTKYDPLGRIESQGLRCRGTDRAGITGYTVEVYNADTKALLDRAGNILNGDFEILLPDDK